MTTEEIIKIKRQYEDENGLGTIAPSDDIPCRRCEYRLRPVEACGKYFHQYKKDTCAVYDRMKPPEILWGEKECEYFEEDPDADELERLIEIHNREKDEG